MTEYRYTLARWVGRAADAGLLVWVMLNPSTADDTVDDQTIRRVRYYTAAAGFGRLEVVNLFAARATAPDDLVSIDDPVGPLNDMTIADAIDRADAVAVAWGASCPTPLRRLAQDRRQMVLNLCRDRGQQPLALGITRSGQPCHPSRLGNAVHLTPWGATHDQ